MWWIQGRRTFYRQLNRLGSKGRKEFELRQVAHFRSTQLHNPISICSSTKEDFNGYCLLMLIGSGTAAAAAAAAVFCDSSVTLSKPKQVLRIKEISYLRQIIHDPITRFNYFASVHVDGDPKMTFSDFLHSFVFSRYYIGREKATKTNYTSNILGDEQGLISITEYKLFLELLKIPIQYFKVAFALFDLDHNGSIDKYEFQQAINMTLHNLKCSNKEKFVLSQCTQLTKHFFGKDGDQKLSYENFCRCLEELNTQILQAEFDLYLSPENDQNKLEKQNSQDKRRWPFKWFQKEEISQDSDTISVYDFALTLVSGLHSTELNDALARIEPLKANQERVSFQEFCLFHNALCEHHKDIELALSFVNQNEGLTEYNFIRAVKSATGYRLPKFYVSLAFRIFDSNGDGKLNLRELHQIMNRKCILDTPEESTGSRLFNLKKCMGVRQ